MKNFQDPAIAGSNENLAAAGRICYSVDTAIEIPEEIWNRLGERIKRGVVPVGTSIQPLAWYAWKVQGFSLYAVETYRKDNRMFLLRRPDGSLLVWRPDTKEKLNTFCITRNPSTLYPPVERTYVVLSRKGGESC